ncbi:MAG: hypothetical protein GC154_18225 [bacterium]|nr:hypothetical protein [bacterium]
MRRVFEYIRIGLLLAASGAAVFAQDGEGPLYTRSTYECISVYWNGAPQSDCLIEYKEAGVGDWKEGFPLTYDPRDGQARGSLVGLKPGAAYDIRVRAGDETHTLQARTRNDRFPIGETTELKAGVSHEALRVTQSGREDAYQLIQPPEGAKSVIDAVNQFDHCIVIDADYVILRGLEVKNAATHAIVIEKGRHDIVIEDCHAVFWGRIGGSPSYGAEGCIDSAVYAKNGAGRLTIQRNLFENPRGGSNDWDTGHPNGPQAVSLIDSSGGNVIRYNEIRSSEDHGFNDGIGGASNFSTEGSPNRDSDIYGNIIANVWDDAIESEGANMNVRIWGNYIEKTFQHVATACTSKGPLYIFRNVFGESRHTHRDSLGGAMIKVGERGEFGGGRKYIFHNTALQPGGAYTVFSGHTNPNTVTRNNIFDCPGRFVSSEEPDPPSDYDYDLFTGSERGAAREPHGVRAEPAFLHSYALEFYPSPVTTKIVWGRQTLDVNGKTLYFTDPVTEVRNPVIDAGVRLANFNDDYAGAAPDLGAFESDRPPLRFGRRAQPDAPRAPWERYP